MRDTADRTTPILERANATIGNVNTALTQVHATLDGVNMQLARVDTITENVAHVSANVANLSTVVSAAGANPLAKVAAFGYSIRKAVGNGVTEATSPVACRPRVSRRGP